LASVGSSNKEAISLNIMPMMDVFSILITFLLISYSADPVIVDPKQGLELPGSMTLVGLDEIPAIAVTKTNIFINDNQVADVVGGDVPEAQRSQGAIQSVYDELIKLKETNDRLAEAQGRKPKLGSLVMEMDKAHVFKLVKRVMLSAQQAEFVTFKLMVDKQSE